MTNLPNILASLRVAALCTLVVASASAHSAKDVHPPHPLEPDKTTRSADSAKRVTSEPTLRRQKSKNQAKRVKRTKSSSKAKPVKRAKPKKHTKRVKRVKRAKPKKRAKPAKRAKSKKRAKPVQRAKPTRPKGGPDVLLVGDSQISFGAGAAYRKFFQNLPSYCGSTGNKSKLLAKLGNRSTATIGVRSTSLHSWNARSGRAKGTICDVDKRWGVNAGVYGIGGDPKRRYVQIGKGKDYQFCKPNQSSFEAMFDDGYYSPRLLVMAFLGNGADRWANSTGSALRDVKTAMSQIPANMPCIFMTTIPVYAKKTNDLRALAQSHVKAAFEQVGGRCSFVAGYTNKTRAASQGNATYFKRRKDGRVKDPHHPNTAAQQRFIQLRKSALCSAVFEQLE